MNIFSYAFPSLIFILCPLFIYIVLISSNNRITSNKKDIIFDATLLSTIYIVTIFISNDYPIINFLLLLRFFDILILNIMSGDDTVEHYKRHPLRRRQRS